MQKYLTWDLLIWLTKNTIYYIKNLKKYSKMNMKKCWIDFKIESTLSLEIINLIIILIK